MLAREPLSVRLGARGGIRRGFQVEQSCSLVVLTDDGSSHFQRALGWPCRGRLHTLPLKSATLLHRVLVLVPSLGRGRSSRLPRSPS